MRRFVICALAFCALAAPAAAADMPAPIRKAQTAAPPYSGLYLGIFGAGAKTAGDFALLDIPGTGNLRPSGFMAGGLIGLGTWTAGGLYLGVEADAAYDFSKQSQPCSFVADCTLKSGWLLTQRVVIGMQLGSITGAARSVAPAATTQWRDSLQMPSTLSGALLMPYVTGGIAERLLKACITPGGTTPEPLPALLLAEIGSGNCARETLVGWTVGGGVQVPVAAGWSLGPEYLYIKWNKHFSPAGDAPIFAADFRAVSEHALRLKLTGHW